jgi:hypothetical protein
MFNKSQIWIETVIYTTMGLAIIGILLFAATPQIDKLKDKSLIEQSISSMNTFNQKIEEVKQNTGAVGIIDFKISKGKLVINPTEKYIEYSLENSKLKFSEPGVSIKEGDLEIKTTIENGERYKITLKKEYNDLKLTNNGATTSKTYQAGSIPYKIRIENLGPNTDQNTQIDFSIL